VTAAEATPCSERRHLPALDGLRGIAILLVMVYHFSGGTDQAARGLDMWFSRVCGVGWAGVDLFFVLSGFLITGILIEARGGEGGLKRFFVRRSLRIFPLYYAVLIALFVGLPLLGAGTSTGLDMVSPHQGWLWTYSGNIAKFFDPSIAFQAGLIQTKHFWSLAVEEQFYLLWPFCVMWLSGKALGRVCVGVACASLALRTGLQFVVGDAVYTFTPCRLEGLMVGAYVAIAWRDAASVVHHRVLVRNVAVGCASVLGVTWLAVGLDNAHWTMLTYGFTVVAVLSGALLVMVLKTAKTSTLHRVLCAEPLRFVGRLAYGLYVFHYLLMPLFQSYFSPEVLVREVFGHYWPSRFASMGLSIAASIAVAWVSWHVLEKHFLALKDRFGDDRARRAEQPRLAKIVVASSGLGHVSRGIESWASDLARALYARGCDVTLCKGGGRAGASYERVVACWVRGSQKARLVTKVVPKGIAWRLGVASTYGVEQVTFALRLLLVLRELKADILHVQDPVVARVAEVARRLGIVRTKTILAHGTEEPNETLARFEHVQHLAPWHQEQCEAAGVSRRGWTTIPNFIDTQRFAPGDGSGVRRELGIPAGALVVMTAAAIKRTHKRIDALIEEFAKLRAANPGVDAFLVIAGGEEKETHAVIEAGRALLGDRVRFCVKFPRERMAELYRAADVFVLASLKEMMPIALLEATATGLPCVVHDHPVMRWMVGAGGVCVDMTKKGTLSTAVANLLSDRARASEVGAAARAHCVAEFGEDAVLDRVLAYYRRLLEPGAEVVPRESSDACGVDIQPKISVVIPAYNASAWVAEAIESVLAQTVPPHEIIAVDDGSTDGTREVLAKYGDRVKVVTQENQGVAAARNHAARVSSGDWIAYLDADDVWHPRKLELQSAAILQRPDVGLLGTRAGDVQGVGNAVKQTPRLAPLEWTQLAVKNHFTASSVMVRRELLELAGGFDTELHGPEDYDLWLRVTEMTRSAVLETELVGYREVPGSLGRRARSMERGLSRVLSKMDERSAWGERRVLRRKARSYCKFSCAYMYTTSGEHFEALRRLVESLLLYPWPYRRNEVRLPMARARLFVRVGARCVRALGRKVSS
jgi:peptidoglycan/LPS O-acetylase OafA/YrhL/glycosyltransferase involved in cell wall biosynthesis